ncbi:MAG: bifunctional methylenetetrahydrofolate dehydrogenase/methenyltetrahydrofolate cyclohydrolase FolD [Kordiimonadaceae bacterium]|jgi:methylenetetrahydrofolate dehydrogenase (NADP+) / methenyltetrahydrofolate cyclohydrolase|nr:bifunctional methylenetetrahydrofolate dehydrogenase/methenyltetrahydrofolate cyclohydrolase FolD [Gammaproteobacteria bacterium]MBT5074073.1 bifunctional methylenetetrahydrofolate dehydrogenase/methenyltetrahydrofolate cyclohydrolase FolD [Kordiimonadaceae bacterium]MBT6034967.1 bifunctional methylenetetrahydrofolate dehydrogenase/methenyltetrahydrofolate cyclohydrolase FolD [Kordiimonadaceae bacterium]MBT6329257.1 bifunctional methylenetetrahydrofolate dehydrogenase/methenyltetrahydrofolate
MTASIIDGKAFAANLKEQIARKVSILKENHNLTPGLAVVLVGEDPASQVYVRNKNKSTKAAGMNSYEYLMDDDVSESELIAKVTELNGDPSVHGILVQLPLPKHINEAAVIETISPEKDVDGFHVINSGLLATGGKGMVPCTPLGCIMMLKDKLGSLSGLDAVVVGRSNIVGKPMAQLLLNESCTVTIAHSRTKNLGEVVGRSDIVVAAVGVPELVKGSWIKPGATVIDVGINRIEKDDGKTKLVGDVEFIPASERAGAITPVPGGVGPMTIAVLLQNTVTAACRQLAIDEPE